jgi:DNA-binding PadR family transcriptional regulator
MANILENITNIGKCGGLRHMVLLTLSQCPKNGAEVINAIEMMCYGTYRPSPGSIYPLLSTLAGEGLICKNAEGRYEITSAGTAAGDFRWQWQWWDCGPYTPYNVIGAIESSISFLQDAGPEQLLPFEGRLDNIIDRMKTLRSLVQEAGLRPAEAQKTC